MGDRAQIIIRRENTSIHLYTHWNGYRLPAILAAGLRAGKPRWGDESYLTRIIFCRMMEREELYEEAGFGISTAYQDSCPETDLIVDMDKQRIFYLSFGRMPETGWSFAEYVALEPLDWSSLKA